MAETFRCRSVLLCDEVREEVGGKQIIIGAYAGAILLPVVPFIGKITFRFELFLVKPNFDHAECTILRPNHSILRQDARPFTVKYPQFPTTIVFTFTEVPFETIGEYTVLLAMDSTPESVGNFFIITPEGIS
jgi:hypothetical protein